MTRALALTGAIALAAVTTVAAATRPAPASRAEATRAIRTRVRMDAMFVALRPLVGSAGTTVRPEHTTEPVPAP